MPRGVTSLMAPPGLPVVGYPATSASGAKGVCHGIVAYPLNTPLDLCNQSHRGRPRVFAKRQTYFNGILFLTLKHTLKCVDIVGIDSKRMTIAKAFTSDSSDTVDALVAPSFVKVNIPL